jgi:hypothetical protein
MTLFMTGAVFVVLVVTFTKSTQGPQLATVSFFDKFLVACIAANITGRSIQLVHCGKFSRGRDESGRIRITCYIGLMRYCLKTVRGQDETFV